MFSVSESFFVYSRYIGGLRRLGGKYNSPLRNETCGSFYVDGITGRWYDYGIGAGGDVIDFVMLYHNILFKDALSAIHSMLDGYDRSDVVLGAGAIKSVKDISLKRLYKITSEQLRVWNHDMYYRHGDIAKMLWDRGLGYDVVNRYRLGVHEYRNKWWLLIPYDYDDEVLTSYKRMRWSGTEKEIFTSGSVRLYPKDMLGKDCLVLCEGELDCLSFISNGIDAITGTGGVNTFKREWVNKFRDKRIVIMFDNDSSGRKGAKSVYTLLKDICCISIGDWLDIVPNAKKGYDMSNYMEDKRDVLLLQEYLWEKMQVHSQS